MGSRTGVGHVLLLEVIIYPGIVANDLGVRLDNSQLRTGKSSDGM